MTEEFGFANPLLCVVGNINRDVKLLGVPASTGTGDALSMCMILMHDRQDLTIPEKLHRSNQIVREFMEGKRVMIPAI